MRFLRAWIQKSNELLPKHMDAVRIARIALTAVRPTPKPLECDQTSFIAAIMQSPQLDVEPNTDLGQAYLIPYGNFG